MIILLSCHLKQSAIDAVVEKDLCKLLDEFRLIKHKFFLMCCSVVTGYCQAYRRHCHFFHRRLPSLKYSWLEQHWQDLQFATWQGCQHQEPCLGAWHECKNIIQWELWTLLNWSISIISCWIPNLACCRLRKADSFCMTDCMWHLYTSLVFAVCWYINKWIKKYKKREKHNGHSELKSP